MGHRHTYCTSKMSERGHDQLWNSWHRDPQLHHEDGSFLFSSENIPLIGVDLMTFSNISVRSNEYLSRFGLDILNYRSTNSVISNDPYLHLPSTSGFNQVQPNHAHHGPYSHFTSGQVGGTYDLQLDYARLPFKRKRSAVSMVLDGGSTSSYYYGVRSSSDFSISSDHLHSKPLLNPQHSPWVPVSMTQDHRHNTISTVGEGSHRNVRSRRSHTLNVEINPLGSHSSSNLPSHYHSITNVHGLSMTGQWNNTHESMATDRRILSSGVGCFNHEINQPLSGISPTSVHMEFHMGCNPNVTWTTNLVSSLPTFHGPCDGQRRTPYRATSSYNHLGLAGTISNGRRSELEVFASSRYSSPSSILGRSIERNGRARNSYDRYQSFVHEENAHSRWLSQDAVMVDQSTYYDSRNMFDEHWNMRLDIDNMSYEELLGFEERIGNVSTGLSEDSISRCLLETIYFFSDQIEDDQEEGICVICLEEYKDRESLGRLKCSHYFHFSCIKKWLQIKNACPICKASAEADSSK